MVKPASEGSTIGVSAAKNTEELKDALGHARRYDHQVFIERFIVGKELTVGILKDEPLPVVEIAPKGGVYDYHAKYTPGMTEYIVPASIGKQEMEEVQRISLKAYHVLGCRGCARVDLLFGQTGEIFVAEVNTLPGMTETSLVPKAAASKGISFPQLIQIILEDASLKIEGGEG
jgi:D-alanine-D-alanine ligase